MRIIVYPTLQLIRNRRICKCICTVLSTDQVNLTFNMRRVNSLSRFKLIENRVVTSSGMYK